MQRFTQLFHELDASNRTTSKLAALKRYFREAPPEDAAWATFFLTGQRIKRPVRNRDFRDWAGEACGYPEWMVEECYDHVGDLAETLALLLATREPVSTAREETPSLHRLVEEAILPLRTLEREDQRCCLLEQWHRLDGPSCFVFNKLITGGFRVGVSKTLVNRALAELASVEPAVMAHRLMGGWTPTEAHFRALFEPDAGAADPAKPYPFCLAYPMDEPAESDPGTALGAVGAWQIEWKWDGIRAQVIKRGDEVILWSRGEELVSEPFPEIVEAAAQWPRDAVLDGELLAWDTVGWQAAPFSQLQRRLGRKTVGAKLRREAPVHFMAYDLLERDGVDWRGRDTEARRQALEAFVAEAGGALVHCSPLVRADNWEAVAACREASRARGVEGLMLKRRAAAYGAGRKKGDWWKWKVDPYTIDAVLVYAQQGHGRRAGLFTDYTFSLWDGGHLVPFAKAYSGLTDKEIRQVDRWIRDHTREKHGPVRVVDPELVFEIAFEGIAESRRHKSGIAVRFPRIHRWRRDKPAAEADSMETVCALLPLPPA